MAMVALFVIWGESFAAGDIDRLMLAVDYKGNICGRGDIDRLMLAVDYKGNICG